MATTLPLPLTLPSRQDQIFPKLTPDQVARAAAHGRTRSVVTGEVLAEEGQPLAQFNGAGVYYGATPNECEGSIAVAYVHRVLNE